MRRPRKSSGGGRAGPRQRQILRRGSLRSSAGGNCPRGQFGEGPVGAPEGRTGGALPGECHPGLAATGYQRVDAKLRSADAWEMVMHRLSLVGVQLVVIDECHHLFRPGAGRDKLGAIQSMKHILQSAGGVSLIIAGVADLREAILSETSGETYRRLQELDLDDIRPGSRETKIFATNFRKSAEVLGIEVSEEDAFVDRILFARNGQIGRSVSLAKAILHDAVTRRRPMLSLERAEAVYRKDRKGADMTPFHAAEWGTVKRELEAIGWQA
nr:TniB family NTP-binding protein [Mangrovicoccus ximenensis]